MHFSLVLIDHPQRGMMRAFDDVILPLYFAFHHLGYQAEILRHRINPSSINILFSTVYDPALSGLEVPANSIVFNLEQLSAENSVCTDQAFFDHLKGFKVWDYSRRNLEFLARKNIQNAEYLPLGFVPEMTRLRRDVPSKHDILFYGLASPRRQSVLDHLKDNGTKVNQLIVGTFGRERDVAIVDSRLYLNIHHYQPATLEVARLGYLWANHMPVVSESGPDTEIYPGLENACAYADYEHLAEKAVELLADENKLKAQAEAGFEAFSALSQEKSLEALVGRRVVHGSGADLKEPRPKYLNVGCGLDFRNEALNLDINEHCFPDLLLDISGPLEAGKLYVTERFGEIELTPGSFEIITAFQVLQHVADLPQAMRNFLDLLEDGGRLIITVPYDLSYGAWQDPAHVRAFNENSWFYFTDSAHHLGWGETRFEQEEISFNLTEIGARLVAKGADPLQLASAPRAIDSMKVKLRKDRMTAEEKIFHENMLNNIYNRPGIVWTALRDDPDIFEEERRQIFSSHESWRKARLKLAGTSCLHYAHKWMALFGLCTERRERLKAERRRLRRLLYM